MDIADTAGTTIADTAPVSIADTSAGGGVLYWAFAVRSGQIIGGGI